jgi:hypothetical protein
VGCAASGPPVARRRSSALTEGRWNSDKRPKYPRLGVIVTNCPNGLGATLEPTDAIVYEWDVAVLAPHFAAALLAREQEPAG